MGNDGNIYEHLLWNISLSHHIPQNKGCFFSCLPTMIDSGAVVPPSCQVATPATPGVPISEVARDEQLGAGPKLTESPREIR